LRCAQKLACTTCAVFLCRVVLCCRHSTELLAAAAGAVRY
jgi:hypothetical protein